jgi:predicted DNA-binding transcriptional regulator YafY
LRTFGLDRIYEPIPLKREFVAPDQQELDNYLLHVYGVYPLPNRQLQEIRFVVTPYLSDYLHAHPIHTSMQRINEGPDGHGVFHMQVIPSLELINFFLSLAPQIRIRKPVWLRNELIAYHHKAIEHAGKI